MLRLFVSFMMISFVIQQVISFNNTEISFSNIPETFEFLEKMYKAGMDSIKSDNKMEKLKKKLDNLSEYSRVILHNEENEKIRSGSSRLFENNNVNNDLQDVKSELTIYMDDIDHWHNKSMMMNELENEKTLKMISNAILWGRKNLPHTMFHLHKLIVPGDNIFVREGFLSLMAQYVVKNYKDLCDNFISPQQWLYSVYIDIIITQMKGFITLAQLYSTRSAVDNEHYVQEFFDAKNIYFKRLMKYNELFIKYLAIFPNDIRRCNIKTPVRGGNFLTLEEYSQIIIKNEAELTSTNDYPSGTCKSSCNNIKNIKPPHINSSISNCVEIAGEAGGCEASNSAHEKWSWLEIGNGAEIYGHKDNNCKKTMKKGYRRLFYYCELCSCTFENWNTKLSISRISLTPQMADIANNMVVVGVRFVIYDRAIHLQIKQAKASKDGFIKTPGEWKPLDKNYDNKTTVFQYFVLTPKLQHNYLNLDDVGVHSEQVVTGVKFHKNLGLELRVHTTAYNYTSGMLLKDHHWRGPEKYHVHKEDYQRERIEIDLSNVDDPLRTQDYYPDRKSNKKVKFQHTSMKKDLGQNTIPFFDAQPAEVVPGFVLGGIGLFHRSHDGFGGFIAPRLFTHNITSILQASMRHMRKKDSF
ncbi:hypothetical protein PV327_010846 [Microctonus hyperodae]|uniref:Uncharacterized protein n=1 Tax=Microctonus hyperodae TaxID=165561 RepID=A0AA39C8X2_MICHY|nr:hypothetical protein PV327_010846 [Microctonus hyperodae]